MPVLAYAAALCRVVVLQIRTNASRPSGPPLICSPDKPPGLPS